MRVQLIKHPFICIGIFSSKKYFDRSAMLPDNVIVAYASNPGAGINPVVFSRRNIRMKFCLTSSYFQQPLPESPTKIGTLISLLSSLVFFVSNLNDVVSGFGKRYNLLHINQDTTIVLIRNNAK